MPRELQIRHPHCSTSAVPDHAVVHAQLVWWMESLAAELRDIIVLLDSVAADAEPADETAILVQGHAPREPDDAALVEIVAVGAPARARALSARIGGVIRVQIEPRAGRRRDVAIDAGRK